MGRRLALTALGIACALAMPACVSSEVASDVALPEVFINQMGFEEGARQSATIRTGARDPLSWELLSNDGAVLRTGQTRVFGNSPAAGEPVHTVEFAPALPVGAYKLVVDESTRHAFEVRSEPYGELAERALGYFYLNRAGTPILASHTPGPQWARAAGHVEERATCFHGKDKMGLEWPGCDYTLDVSGGWYDAGDHGKYVVNGGISVWMLQNAAERMRARGGADQNGWGDGRADLPEAGNGVSDILDEARWELEFLLAMQVPDGTQMDLPIGLQSVAGGQPLQLTSVDASGLVHHKVHTRAWSTLPLLPENDTAERFLIPPSTAATLNMAAAAAQAARLWRGVDDAFADRCLRAARSAYDAAKRVPDIYAYDTFDGGGAYGDDNVSDEFAWAAMELFATTGDASFVSELASTPGVDWLIAMRDGGLQDIFWAEVGLLPAATMVSAGDVFSENDRARAVAVLLSAADRYVADAGADGYGVPNPPYAYDWGSNGGIASRAVPLGYAFDETDDSKYRDGAVAAMDYLLGRNPLDQSYVAGFGTRPVKFVHHRFWAAGADPSLPIAAPGALSGGPNSGYPTSEFELADIGPCAPQKCWADDHTAYSLNEVAINWNAALFWLASYLETSKPADASSPEPVQ
ncbi:MAG: glycoside hydrolase family 9 protein [Pseudomonadota bacterium]